MIETNLKLIADNKDLFDAIKDVLRKQFSFGDIKSDWTQDKIGEEVKAVLVGKKLLEQGFDEIEKHKTSVTSTESLMPGR